jgi:hypothetical protein
MAFVNRLVAALAWLAAALCAVDGVAEDLVGGVHAFYYCW